MSFFGLIKNKCFYCRSAITKGEEHEAAVKIIGYTGTFNKKFCSKDHVSAYNTELNNKPQKEGGGSCCG